MSCRPLVVVAVVFGGLVPVAQLASAELPTRPVATATATILSPVSTRDLFRQADPVKNSESKARLNITIKDIDDNGFVIAKGSAPLRSPHRNIIIIDLP
jgi:hypothetical protein